MQKEGVGERAHKLFYELAQANLEEQRTRNTTIENKSNWVLGFSATLIGIMGLVLPDAAPWTTWIAVAAGVFFLASAALIFGALRVRDFETKPTSAQVQEHINDFDEPALREWTAIAMTEAADSNNTILECKANCLRWALHSFIVEAILVAIVSISIAFN